jgi:hypothetical protein
MNLTEEDLIARNTVVLPEANVLITNAMQTRSARTKVPSTSAVPFAPATSVSLASPSPLVAPLPLASLSPPVAASPTPISAPPAPIIEPVLGEGEEALS